MKIRKAQREKSRLEILLERQKQVEDKKSQGREKSRLKILLERQKQVDQRGGRQKRLDERIKEGVYSSGNPKKIYAVLANGFDDKRGHSITELLFFYKMLKNNNVRDENITLLLHNKLHEDYTNTYIREYLRSDPTPFTKEHIKNAEINQKIKEYASLTKNEIGVDIKKATKNNFLSSIKNLKSNYNDTVYIFYNGHGYYSKNRDEGGVKIGGEFIMDIDLNRAIGNIEYERLIVVGSTCHSAGLLKNLNKPRKIKNTLAIASSKVRKKTYDGWGIKFVIKYEKYKKLSDIINKTLKPKVTAIPIYFDTEKEECPFLNEPFIKPYM